MSRIEAYRHLREDRPFVNCASAVVHALSPQTPLEIHSRAVINDAATRLVDVASCIFLEHARVGNCVLIQPMRANEEPSNFFRQTIHQATQSGQDTFLVGGLMVTLERDELHIIGVLNHHKGNHNMFSVCDTARLNRRELIRKMTYREMDTRIIPSQKYPYHRAVVMFGKSLRSFEEDRKSGRYLYEVDNEIAAARRIVETCLYRSGFQHLLKED